MVWAGAGYETAVRANRDEEGIAINTQITIPLDIPDVRVVYVEQNARAEWTITVESTIEGTRCRLCGRELKELHAIRISSGEIPKKRRRTNGVVLSKIWIE